MLIGELAQRAGTSSRALRYYEQHGLVKSSRAANGYRTYAESEVRVVREIRALLEAGFVLADIHPFVACLRAGHRSGDVCPDSVAVLRRRLAEIDAYVAELDGLRRSLRAQLAHALQLREEPECDKPQPR